MKESIGDNSCVISFFCISLFPSHKPHLIDALNTCCFIILFSNWHLCSSSTHIHMYSCSLQRTFDMFLSIAPDKKFNAFFSLHSFFLAFPFLPFSLHSLTMKVTLPTKMILTGKLFFYLNTYLFFFFWPPVLFSLVCLCFFSEVCYCFPMDRFGREGKELI